MRSCRLIWLAAVLLTTTCRAMADGTTAKAVLKLRGTAENLLKPDA